MNARRRLGAQIGTFASLAAGGIALSLALSDAGAQEQQRPGAQGQQNQQGVQGQGRSDEPKTIGIMERRERPSTFPRFERASVANGRAVVVGATQGRASQTTQAQACFTCHGLHGAGDGTGAFPRLSGQPAFYLYKQLIDYASGSRPNDIMTPIAQALTVQEMEDVAAYYAAQTGAPSYPPRQADPMLVQRGGALSAIGSAEKGIQACVNCHGPAGTGVPPSFPYLAGQYATYVELQLQLWQKGVRKNDPLNVMADIAKRMGPEDVRAVATYFQSVRPPGAGPSEAPPAGAALPETAPVPGARPSGAAR